LRELRAYSRGSINSRVLIHFSHSSFRFCFSCYRTRDETNYATRQLAYKYEREYRLLNLELFWMADGRIRGPLGTQRVCDIIISSVN